MTVATSRPAMPRTVELSVTSKSAAADGVVAVTLAHPGGERLPDWTPGAHIDLVLPGGLTRQYSLCGDRWDPYSYRIGVLREPAGRGGSAYIHDELAVGAAVAVGGPRNNFALAPSPRYLFIAGGIGITPLLPMVEQAERVGADWRLLYGGRARRSMAFTDELGRYGGKVTLVPQDERGLPDLRAWLGGVAPDARVYCCGPGPLLEAVHAYCAGWPQGRLRTECFVPRYPGAAGPGHAVPGAAPPLGADGHGPPGAVGSPGRQRRRRGRAVVLPPGDLRHLRDHGAGRRA
jgi:ferredoxin-NADP reductase